MASTGVECIAITGVAFKGVFARRPEDHNDSPVYVSQDKKFVLYNNGAEWRISADIDAAGIYAFHSVGEEKDVCNLQNYEAWQIADRGAFVRAHTMSLTKFHAKDANYAPKYLRVDGRMGANGHINGGYHLFKTHRDRPVYKNELSNVFLFFNGKCWIIGPEVGGTAAFARCDDLDACEPAEINEDWYIYEKSAGANSGDFVCDPEVYVTAVVPFETYTPTTPAYDDKDFGRINNEKALGRKILDECTQGPPVWVRAYDLWGKAKNDDAVLFDGIEPSDLLQGSVGNCWLIAAISAVAEFPSAIVNLFESGSRVNPQGQYQVRLFDVCQDRWRTITVDDFIPCRTRQWWEPSFTPLFAKPNGNEMWVLILEKAIAKFIGNYSKLDGGHVSYAWQMLTGAKDQFIWKREDGLWKKRIVHIDSFKKDRDFEKLMTVDGKDDIPVEDFFATLKGYDEESYLLGASISGAEGELRRTDGLVENHAYTVIEAHQDARTGIRLLKIRNPWGTDYEWNGAWGDDSDLWEKYPHIAEAVEFEKAPDGTFYMSYEDFSETFNNVKVSALKMERDHKLKQRRKELFKKMRLIHEPVDKSFRDIKQEKRAKHFVEERKPNNKKCCC